MQTIEINMHVISRAELMRAFDWLEVNNRTKTRGKKDVLLCKFQDACEAKDNRITRQLGTGQ